MKIQEIAEKIKDESKIVLLPHIHSDGDCIGSSFALSLALKKLNKNVLVVMEEDISDSYNFLVGQYSKYDELNIEKFSDAAIICLDCGDELRLGKRIEIFKRGRTTLNIDHHISNNQFAQYNYVDSSASATGEIIFDIIQLLDVPIDKEIAENLYVAIATDTGGFRYSNTTSKTHKIVSNLLETEIDVAEINLRIFETTTIEKLKLKAKAIEFMEFYDERKIALIVVPYEFLKEFNVDEKDIDGLASLPRTVEGVEVGILIKETEPGMVKVSFRSNRYIDVSKIAFAFGGGGHQRASGCTLEMEITAAKAKILEAVKAAFTQEVGL